MSKNDVKQSSAQVPATVWTAIVGLALVGVGTLLPILRVDGDYFKYIYCVGAVMTLVGRALSSNRPGASLRLRRLCRMEVWTGIMFCVGGVFMFYPNPGSRDWLAFTLAGGVIQVYTSIMIPRREAEGK